LPARECTPRRAPVSEGKRKEEERGRCVGEGEGEVICS